MTDSHNDQQMTTKSVLFISNRLTSLLNIAPEVYSSTVLSREQEELDDSDNDIMCTYLDWDIATDTDGNPALRIVLDPSDNTFYLYQRSGYLLPEQIEITVKGLASIYGINVVDRHFREEAEAEEDTCSHTATTAKATTLH